MDQIAQQMIEVRQQIGRLRAALYTPLDDSRRCQVYRRLTEYVTEAQHLFDQRIQMDTVGSPDAPPREQSVGEPPSE
jgi:hypothetical protein